MGCFSSKKAVVHQSQRAVKVFCMNSMREKIISLIRECTIELSESKKELDLWVFHNDQEKSLLVLKKQEYIKNSLKHMRRLIKNIDDLPEQLTRRNTKYRVYKHCEKVLAQIDMDIVRTDLTDNKHSDNSALTSSNLQIDELDLQVKLYNIVEQKQASSTEGVFRQKFVKKHKL